MYGLPKDNRLCGQKRIQRLYKEGRRFTSWPLRVTYMPSQGETEVLVWASKSLFKRAVKRNRLRRLMREAYRLNHMKELQETFLIAFNYIDKEMQPYATIERAMRKALIRIAHDTSKV